MALKIISRLLFETMAIVDTLELCERNIKNHALSYSQRLYFLSCFKSLFGALASHAKEAPRIKPKWCAKYISIANPELLKILPLEICNQVKDEVFLVYSNSQQRAILAFDEQLNLEQNKVPSFVVVQSFEKIIFDEDVKELRRTVENIETSLRATNLNLDSVTSQIRVLNTVILYSTQVLLGDQKTQNEIIKLLVQQDEATKNFSNFIYFTLKENDNLTEVQKQELNELGDILEKAISHREEYYKNRTKQKLIDGFAALAGIIPGNELVTAYFSFLEASEANRKQQEERLGL